MHDGMLMRYGWGGRLGKWRGEFRFSITGSPRLLRFLFLVFVLVLAAEGGGGLGCPQHNVTSLTNLECLAAFYVPSPPPPPPFCRTFSLSRFLFGPRP